MRGDREYTTSRASMGRGELSEGESAKRSRTRAGSSPPRSADDGADPWRRECSRTGSRTGSPAEEGMGSQGRRSERAAGGEKSESGDRDDETSGGEADGSGWSQWVAIELQQEHDTQLRE